jgi:hypothetical protein
MEVYAEMQVVYILFQVVKMENKNIALSFGMVILLALAGTGYYLTNIDHTYYCEDRNVMTMCFNLSESNNNISNRCYYNETMPTKYFKCSSGWKPAKDFPKLIKNMTITGKEITDINYKDNSMRVEFIGNLSENKIGEITLKSHDAIDQQRYVDSKENGAVMWYEMNFTDEYKDGLGEVKFIDMKTGKEIQKNYSYVIKKHTIFSTKQQIPIGEILFSNGSVQKSYGEETINVTIPYWDKLDTNNIPKGDNTIGITVDNLVEGEMFDAIWTITDKQITRHAIIYVYDAHGRTLNADAEDIARLAGVWFFINQNLTLNEAVLYNNEFTYCAVGNSTVVSGSQLTKLAIATPSGTNVTFNVNLTAGQRYWLACNGTTHWGRNNWGCGTNSSGVINQTNINWSSGYLGDGSILCGQHLNDYSWGINIVGIRTSTGLPDVYLNITGKVVDSNYQIVPNATVLILNSSGSLITNTTSNESGDWRYEFINGSLVNYTIAGYNPFNISQGGNIYPFINA